MNKCCKIKNGYSFDKNGWKYISINGSPRERGYAYGYLCAKDFKEIQKLLNDFLMLEMYGETWEFFIRKINNDFKELTKREFKELYDEMVGIAEGCNANGCNTTIDEIIAWNFYCSIPYWYPIISGNNIGHREGGAPDKCSAFMATGKDWTKDGKIVVAHNSFVTFVDGQYSNIILNVTPSSGHNFIMQTSPCWIWSGTDFFITSAGIIGTETTIGGFLPYEKKHPIGYRIRQAMQYGNTLDDYVKCLLHENSGDYANSWLFGDINSNEILRIELGLKFHDVERTKNGYFIGFNAPYNPKIRNLEVTNSGFYDIRRHQGARKVRLDDLMDTHKGKINIQIAKQIIADHYDVYLNKHNNPCSRTVCSHYDLDDRAFMSQSDRPKPYQPHGAVDGIVCDSTMAKSLSFYGRFGNSCGTPFISKSFFNRHRQWKNFSPWIKDRPTQKWTIFSENQNKSCNNITKTNKNNKKTNKLKKLKHIKNKTNKNKFKS